MFEFQKIKNSLFIKEMESTNIIEEIFSYLDETQKLKMIIYNKELQKLLLVDFEDYKENSRKYILGESNGKGKEYNKNNGKLIFEVEYLNGKRNGKGKEYNYNGKLIFEGEYLNGKRNGKGKEYHFNNKLRFEGDYLNGKIWNGKGFNIKDNFEFEINNGKGYIKEYNIFNGKFYFLSQSD